MRKACRGIVGWLGLFAAQAGTSRGRSPRGSSSRAAAMPLDGRSMFNDKTSPHAGALSFPAAEVPVPGNTLPGTSISSGNGGPRPWPASRTRRAANHRVCRKRESKVIRSASHVLALLCATSFSAAAQSNLPWQEYDRLVERGREIAPLDTGSMFGEQIDMYTGALSFSATDVSIPGNSGLPVAMVRKLAIYDRQHYGGGVRGPFADWAIDIPNVNGVFAPTWHDNRCTQAVPPGVGSVGSIPGDEYWAGNMAELPGGGEMLQADVARPKPDSGGPYRWVTEGNTYFSCLSTIKNGSGQGFLAIDSNGNKYWLDHMAQYSEPSYRVSGHPSPPPPLVISRKKNVLYASRVEDRFGNWVTYSYSNAYNQPVRLTAIASNDGRSLTLQYNGSGYVSSVSDGARTWTYTYTSNSLTKVTLPDGSHWTLNLAALSAAIIHKLGGPDDMRSCFTPTDHLPQDFTGSITHPSGATATFVVGSGWLGRTNVPGICRNYQPPGAPSGDTRDDFPVFPVHWVSLVARSKQIQGVGVEPMQWTYESGSSWSWQYPPGQSQPICQTTTCADPVCLSDSCAGTRGTVIHGPGGRWERYVFGNSYRYNEGKLLAHTVGTDASNLHKSILHTYNYATSGQPYPAKIGTSPQPRGAGFTSEYTRPLVKTETLQDGASFVWEVEKGCETAGVYCFDSLARPLKIKRTSTVSTGGTGNDPVVPPASAPALTAPATSSTGNYTLTWTSIASASAYELRERLGSGAWNTIHNAGNTTAAVSGNASGSWNYQVRACNLVGCSAWSATKTTVVTVPPAPAPTLTAPPSNTTGSYTVSWTAVSGATRYELDQRKDGGAWSKIHDASATSRVLIGQVAGSYDYRVRACNTAGCSAYSTIANTVVSAVALGVPTLSAPSSARRGALFPVSWTAVSGATQYMLEYTFNGTVYSAYTGAATSVQMEHYTEGTYSYRVKACNGSGCGNYSNVKAVVVQGGVVMVAPTDGGNDE